MEFVHLHNLTDYSVGKGFMTTEELINAAIKDNQKVLAITDKGIFSSAINFFKIAKKNGIKPIIGLELTLTKSNNDNEFESGHITLLCQSIEGYKNLVQLNNIAFKKKSKNGSIKLNHLKKYNNDLILMTGGIDGILSKNIKANKIIICKNILEILKEIF